MNFLISIAGAKITSSSGSKPKLFSLILPVCHGGGFLRNALQSIGELSFLPDRFETIIIGTEGDSASKKIIEEIKSFVYINIISLAIPGENRSAQLNAGCEKACGRILVFVEDDCIIRKDMLEALAGVFEREKNIGIVGGQDELVPTESAFDLALDEALNSFLGTGGLRRKKGPRVGKYYPRLWNMAVPRDAALSVATGSKNGIPIIFNEALTVHEDVELAKRIEDSGKQIIFAPEVRVGHSRDTTFRSFVKRNFAMARSSRAIGAHRLPHTALALFVLSAILLAPASFFLSPLRYVFGLQMAAYLSALLASAAATVIKTRNIRLLALIPFLQMSLHFARGVGYLIPFSGRRKD